MALAIGTYFEGEVSLALGGWAARGGLLSLPCVLLAGGIGVVASDWTCFLIGRSCRRLLRRWWPALYRRAEAAVSLIDAHPWWFVLGFQFVPGASTATPIAIGMSRISAWRFLLLDLIGVGLWSCLFTGLGYLFGGVLAAVMGDMNRGAWLAPVLLALGFTLWWLRHRRVSGCSMAEEGCRTGQEANLPGDNPVAGKPGGE